MLSVPVDVAAPPWATPWAYSGYSLVLVGALVTRSQRRKFEREAEHAASSKTAPQERRALRQVDLEANDELARASITDR